MLKRKNIFDLNNSITIQPHALGSQNRQYFAYTENAGSQKLIPKGLAKLFNTSYSVIGKYERDEMLLSIDAAKKIAKLIDTTVGYLLGEVKDMDVFKDTAILKRLNDITALFSRRR